MDHRATIAFDLDGTLVDTAADLIATLNLVLDEAGLKPVPFEEARNLVGGGARILIERGLKLERAKVAPAELDRMLARFLVHYETHLADNSVPFPGVVEMLDMLESSGAISVVCTNKPERFSVKLLKALGIADPIRVHCRFRHVLHAQTRSGTSAGGRLASGRTLVGDRNGWRLKNRCRYSASS